MLTLTLIEACDKLVEAKTVMQLDQAASQILEALAILVESAGAIETFIQEAEPC